LRMQLIADFIGFEVVWEADAPDERTRLPRV
jgi:hypothetical protein